METAIEIHKEVEKKATSTLKNNLKVNTIKINQWVRQGDIYIRRIENITGKVPLESRQLAPGNTKGSRHVIPDSIHVNIFEGYVGKDIHNFMKGPQIEAKEEFTVTHPEHAHMTLPKGNYQVTYQLDFAKQERAKD